MEAHDQDYDTYESELVDSDVIYEEYKTRFFELLDEIYTHKAFKIIEYINDHMDSYDAVEVISSMKVGDEIDAFKPIKRMIFTGISEEVLLDMELADWNIDCLKDYSLIWVKP